MVGDVSEHLLPLLSFFESIKSVDNQIVVNGSEYSVNQFNDNCKTKQRENTERKKRGIRR